jgi:hypothetical protein
MSFLIILALWVRCFERKEATQKAAPFAADTRTQQDIVDTGKGVEVICLQGLQCCKANDDRRFADGSHFIASAEGETMVIEETRKAKPAPIIEEGEKRAKE